MRHTKKDKRDEEKLICCHFQKLEYDYYDLNHVQGIFDFDISAMTYLPLIVNVCVGPFGIITRTPYRIDSVRIAKRSGHGTLTSPS